MGNNQYAYQEGTDANSPYTFGMKRESNGALVAASINVEPPSTGMDLSYYTHQPILAVDPTDHVASAVYEFIDPDTYKPAQLATYTADSHGNLNTASKVGNMPHTALFYVTGLSISPSGKLLAVGGAGFQVFHFNGSSPITHYTGRLQADYGFQQFGWDGDNHLYALGGGKLFVYTVTPTSIKEASGSPYSIPEASSVTVLSLK